MDFSILGPLEVRDGPRPVPVGRGKQRAVLALLLLNAGRVVSSDMLVDELWGEQPPATVAKALQVYVSKLRKALGAGVIATRPPGYALEVEAEQLDHKRFERLVEEGFAAQDPRLAAELLASALALWRGPALADLAYEPFAQSEIVRLEELRLAALEERIEADLALGRHAELAGELEAHVSEQPLRERLRGQLILALYRSGRQADALEAYRRAREALVEELGIEPSAALAELERAVLNQDPALDPPVAAALPVGEAPPAPPPAPTEERKLVTVLFAEIERELDSDSDPEQVSVVLESVHAAAVDELETAGGTIERGVAEALLATFGAPIAQEDHAERALHGALAVRDRLSEVASATTSVRIGVESGEVLVRGAEGDALTIRGHPVVSAARLARSAAPGDVVVGDRAAATVRGGFELSERNGAHLLVRALGLPAQRGTSGLGRTFVGRESELDVLRATQERVAREQRPHVVTIVGEAGVGKTRLVRALRERIGPQPIWHVGRCLAYGRGITYRPLAEILRKRLGVLESSHPEAVRAQLGERAILGLTLGLEPLDELNPWEARERLREAWVGEFEAIAAAGPAVVVIEDVHWADAALLELLDMAVREVRGPLYLIATARPELVDRDPAWGTARRNATRVWLEPLGPAEAARLVAGLAGELPPEIGAHVLDRAGGNPFFVEEVLQSLLDQGVLRPQNGGLVATAAPEQVPIADSIQAVIAARIDLLPSAEKRALQAGAVIGRAFWAGAVQALSGGAQARLDMLEERDFVRRSRESTLAGEREYVFKHALTRDVAYGLLPVARRARLHAGFAGWLEGTGRARDENASMLAHHLAEAAAIDTAWADEPERAAELSASAVRWLRRAGELAYGRNEMEAAAALFQQAVPIEAEDGARADLLRASARASASRFEMDGFRAAMEQAVAMAPEGPARARLYAELAQEGSQPYMWKNPPAGEVVESWIEAALERSEPNSASRAMALASRAFLDAVSGAPACREALALAQSLGDPELLSFVYEGMADCATAAGGLEEARDWIDHSLALTFDLADPDRDSGRLFHGAFVYLRLGLIDEGRRLAELHEDQAGRLTPHHEVHAVALRLLVEMVAGRWESARGLAARAAAACAANGETPCQFNWRSLLMAALAFAQLGEDDEARRFEQQASEAVVVAGPLGREPALLRLALRRGDLPAAERLLAADPGHGVWDVDYRAARLDGLVAIGDRDGVEREAPPALELGGYVEPFALRALGRMRGDAGLLRRAEAGFEELGLAR